MVRSRVNLVRVEVVSEVLRQEHVLELDQRAKAAQGDEETLFKGLFTKFYMRETR